MDIYLLFTRFGDLINNWWLLRTNVAWVYLNIDHLRLKVFSEHVLQEYMYILIPWIISCFADETVMGLKKALLEI